MPRRSASMRSSRARPRCAAAGADVIDLGCLPDTPFPHLEDAVRALKARGLRGQRRFRRRGRIAARRRGAGADFLLSLTERHARHRGRDRRDAGAHSGDAWRHGVAAARRGGGRAARHQGDPRSGDRSDPFRLHGRRCRATPSCARRLPDAEILMGTGNLTELTDADTSGVTAMLLGICSELHIRNVLVVQVSPHTRRTIEEHDAARRIMFAAREDASLPQGLRRGAAAAARPASRSPIRRSEIAELAARGQRRQFPHRDRRGRHPRLQPRTAITSAQDAFALFPEARRRTRTAPHAFYLGAELTKAEIAWRLGKRYAQDEPLDWGCAVDRAGRGPHAAARGRAHVARRRSET